MRGRRIAILGSVLAVAGAVPAAAANRYELAGGCYAIKAPGGFIAKDGGGYKASAGAAAQAEPIRMQATALGRYLLFDKSGAFLSAGDGTTIVAAPAASGDGDWRLDDAAGDTFTLTLGESGQKLVAGSDGALSTGGSGSSFSFTKTAGCAQFPESEVNVSGTPRKGATSYVETKGLIETHLHGMAFEFIGGSLHCGRPWHPYGITFAMVDCPDHGPNGQGAAAENFLAYGDPSHGHKTDGWPTFEGWPHHKTYTHEQVYWKNLERAWRGGLRLYTNLLVDNGVLCELYPLKRNSCNEMDNVRLQLDRMYELQDYVDAQEGGPGKGWFRIVTDPFQAREVINDGKLAVILGIEVSRPFDCTETNHVPECTRAGMDAQFEEMYKRGVRQMELTNKFDNALVGVAGDGGTFGLITNQGNKYETGHYLAMQTCTGPTAAHDHDNEQSPASSQFDRDQLAGALMQMFLPPDAAPAYPPAPHCNAQGLTALGAYLIRRMAEKHMLFDPDHMSVLGRDQAMSVVEAMDYAGVLSSHGWSTPDTYRRILALGGLVTPAPKSSEGFVKEWQALQPFKTSRFLFGTGFSTDMNGFAAQGGPRAGNDKNPVVYPFRSIDGSTMVDRHKVGSRVYDINKDGTAHFGLYIDRIADIERIAPPQAVADLLRGAEAYLQTWERAEGVRPQTCRAAQRRFTSKGLGEIRIGQNPEALLRSAGQPQERQRVWTWCVNGTRPGLVKAVLTDAGRVALVASTAPLHKYADIGRGRSEKRVARIARRVASGLYTRAAGKDGNTVVYGVRKGKVTFVAVVSPVTAKRVKTLRATLKLAKLR